MHIAARFKNFGCKESGEENIYVLQLIIPKRSITLEALESLNNLQGQPVDLVMTSLEQARYDEVMTEKEMAGKRQQELDLDSDTPVEKSQESNDDQGIVDLEEAKRFFSGWKDSDGTIYYVSEHDDGTDTTYAIFCQKKGEDEASMHAPLTYPSPHEAQDVLNELAAEQEWVRVIESASDTPSLPDPNVVDAEFTESADEHPITETEVEDVVKTAIPLLISYIRENDKIIRLEKKRRKSVDPTPLTVTEKVEGGVNVKDSTDTHSFISIDCLNEDYRLVLSSESVVEGDILYNPELKELLPHEVREVLDDDAGVSLEADELSFEVNWEQLDGHYRMLRRTEQKAE